MIVGQSNNVIDYPQERQQEAELRANHKKSNSLINKKMLNLIVNSDSGQP